MRIVKAIRQKIHALAFEKFFNAKSYSLAEKIWRWIYIRA